MAMPSNYWAKRYEDESERAFGLGKMTSRNLRKQADIIIRRMEKNVNDWYQRYADENGISLADARKELNARELKAFKMTLEEYRRQAEQEGLSDEYKRMLKQASIRKRLDREQELYINTVHELERWAKTQDADISDLLNKVYESTNYHTAHLTQTMKGEYGKYGQVDPNTVQRIIHSPWAPDGKDFSERIWDNRKKLAKTMQSEFTQAMIIGQGTADISKAIVKNMNTSYSNANRLVETELARVHSQAFMDCMAELDVDAVEILATLDSKTSPICRRMDGKIVQRKDAKPGITIPPFHCHCRSTTVPYLGDDLADIAGNGTRAARDPKTGKTVFVEGELDYGEWEKRYISEGRIDDRGKDTPPNEGKTSQAHVKQMGSYEAGIENAYQKALSHGKRTGTEGLFWRDKKGDVAYPDLSGDSSSVVFPPELVRFLEKLPAKSVDCVHNHPRSSSFSPDDLIVMCDFESIDKMLVIGHNGIKYKVSIGAGDRPYPAEIKAIYEQVKWEYKGFYERMTAAGFSEQAIWQAISHKITTRMAEKYGWEYERTKPKK
jgi:SPP1 gp7 family putative phage head morphogenesis protein|nr:MAG TPA: minor capsid protein [Caudoviricetes sp.]